jgi:hypothetical protein
MEYPVLPPLPFRRYPDETLQTVYPRDRGLSPSQIALLEEIYYEDGHHFGAVKLFDILRELYTERQAVEKIYLKQLTRWLYAQETHQLNKQRPKQIGNKPFRVNSPRSVLQCDLVNMESHLYQGYKYLLTCIDLFSRYAWVFAITNRRADTCGALINALLVEQNFKVLTTDNGGEFAFIVPDGVKHLKGLAYSPTSQSYIERFNGTFRLASRKFFSTGKSDWISFSKQFVLGYNNSRTKALKETPNRVHFVNDLETNAELADARVVEATNQPLYGRDELWSVGQTVRLINKQKIKSGRSDMNTWLGLYEIIEILVANEFARNRYKIKRLSDGVVMEKYFNTSNLQLVQSYQ